METSFGGVNSLTTNYQWNRKSCRPPVVGCTDSPSLLPHLGLRPRLRGAVDRTRPVLPKTCLSTLLDVLDGRHGSGVFPTVQSPSHVSSASGSVGGTVSTRSFLHVHVVAVVTGGHSSVVPGASLGVVDRSRAGEDRDPLGRRPFLGWSTYHSVHYFLGGRGHRRSVTNKPDRPLSRRVSPPRGPSPLNVEFLRYLSR